MSTGYQELQCVSKKDITYSGNGGFFKPIQQMCIGSPLLPVSGHKVTLLITLCEALGREKEIINRQTEKETKVQIDSLY